jgi:hypothetical protein
MIKSFLDFFGAKVTPQSTGDVAYAIRWIFTGILLIAGVATIQYLLRRLVQFMQHVDRSLYM